MRLILASNSRSRRELFDNLDLKYEVIPSNIEEVSKEEDPAKYVMDLSAQKAEAISVEDGIIISADSIAYIEGERIEKPKTLDEAREMQRKLSGKTSYAYTGVTIVDKYKDIQKTFFEVAEVHFREIDEAEIEWYIEHQEYIFERAGYSIAKKSSVFVDYDDILVKGLSFRAQYGRILTFNEEKNYSPEYFITTSRRNDLSSLFQQRNNGDTWSNTNYFSYNTKVSKMNIGATLGMELVANSWSNLAATAYEVSPDDDLLYLDNAKSRENWSIAGAKTHNRLASGFFRANLSWDNKYLLTGTVRADGSSRFHENQRWGYFPSFSAGWNVVNEGFMESVKEVLPILKFRAGWGLVANQDSADDVGYLSSVNNAYTTAFNKIPVQGSVQEQLANKELTWESAEQLNFEIGRAHF